MTFVQYTGVGVARGNDLAVLLTWGIMDWVPSGPALLVPVPQL